MRTKHFSILLAISLVTAFIVPIVAAARPLVPNPEHDPNWAVGVWWGTKLRLENTGSDSVLYYGEAWFGEGVNDNYDQSPAPPSGYLTDIMAGGKEPPYYRYTIASLGQTAPGGGKEDNWYIRFRIFGSEPYSTATVSSVIGDADNDYVPQDYSVVLENGAQKINLRVENGQITGIGPKWMILYVDNAVNITSVTTADPTTGTAGDPLTLSVTVANTGRYTDTYSVSANAGSVSTGALAAGSSAVVSVPATYPAGTQAIVVTAAGAYAKDEDSSLVLTGEVPIVFRAYDTGYASDTAGGIAPWENYYLGDNAPIMVAKKIGAGAVVAASWNGGINYYHSASYPSADNMDVLFDITFQWMVPGATKVIWYDGDSVYSGYKTTNTTTKKMLDNLRAKGYTIDNQNLLRLDNLGSSTYDVLVLNQEQMGTRALGGDPSLLWDNELLAI